MRNRAIVLATFSIFLTCAHAIRSAQVNALNRDSAIGMNLEKYQYASRASPSQMP